MKTTRFALSALLGLAAIAGAHAADTKTSSRVEVIFSDPDKFSDAADGPRGSDLHRDANLDELRSFIVRRADSYLPAGDKLTVTITDVDLAGEIEPWRNPANSELRIIKDIYPPKIDLSYKLTDASGAVVKEGKRHLTDQTFNMNIYPNRTDRRVYENGLLDDWIRHDFGGLKRK